MQRPCAGVSTAMMQKTVINSGCITESSSILLKVTDSAENATATFTGTGEQGFTEKGQDFLWELENETICSVPTVMIPTNLNLKSWFQNHLHSGQRIEEMKNKHYTRREFLRNLTLMTFASMSLPILSSCSKDEVEDFLQKHFLEMTEEEKKQVIAKLEKRYFEQYGKKFQISTKEALPETLWGYGLELSRCIGCRRCVYACVQENNHSRYARQLHWIRVLRLKRGNLINLEDSEHYYAPETVPEKGFVYLPVQCQQCQNPPCVKVCPIHATWQEPDGIVVVDYNWCIGCRYCIAACPYKGRVFNWAEPNLPKDEVNPHVHYLGNRPRMKCAVEKCTYCIQRVREGRYPACVEACPTGSRKFGNLLDPKSEIRYIIERKRVFRLKEDLNTEPKFYYFFES